LEPYRVGFPVGGEREKTRAKEEEEEAGKSEGDMISTLVGLGRRGGGGCWRKWYSKKIRNIKQRECGSGKELRLKRENSR
jgi:hypothetical protein